MNHATQSRVPITAPLLAQGMHAGAILVVTGVLLLTLSAKIQIPLWPVPMTMQTYVILVIGMAYGTRMATVTVLGYLIAGAIGLPVFAGTPEKGLGLPYMLGPTGGYLIGFLLATLLMGRLAERGWDRRIGLSVVGMTAGHLLILACGVTWLAVSLGWERAIAVGATPFVIATILKTVLAGATLPLAWRWVHRLREG
jgi:biotin transport system substrate-specific component